MYSKAAVISAVVSVFLMLTLVENKAPAKENNNKKPTKESNYPIMDKREVEGICGDAAGLSNPAVLDVKCPEYKMELVEDDKKNKGTSPTCTEVVSEARSKGLVPIAIFSIFASAEGDNMSKSMPANLNALVSSLFYTAAKEDSAPSGNNYVFLKGTVADAFGENDEDKKKDEEKDEEKDDEKDDEDGDESGAANNDGEGKGDKSKKDGKEKMD